MSIINQMLKDLEKRSPTPHSSDLILQSMSSSMLLSNKKNFSNLYKIITLMVVTFMLMTLIHHWHNTRLSKTKSAAVNPASQIQANTLNSKEVAPPVLAPLHITPAILTAITVQVDKDTTSLRFLLSQDALYKVTTNENNQLIISLENSRLVTTIPPINATNSAINEIAIQNQQDGDLKIVLSLKAGVDLTHLELNTTGKLPELQLDLLSTGIQPPSTLPALTNNPVAPLASTDSIIKLRTDTSWSDLYQQALQLSTQGHSHDAVKMLTSILNHNPDYTDVRKSLASLLIAQGNTVQAEQVIKIGLQQRPYYPDFVELKARLLVDDGQINKALELLQLAPPLLASNPEYHAFIAALYQRQGKSQYAEKLYEQLLAVQPNNAKWWMGLGIALDSLGKNSLAMQAYVRAGNSGQLNPELKMFAESRVQNLQ